MFIYLEGFTKHLVNVDVHYLAFKHVSGNNVYKMIGRYIWFKYYNECNGVGTSMPQFILLMQNPNNMVKSWRTYK